MLRFVDNVLWEILSLPQDSTWRAQGFTSGIYAGGNDGGVLMWVYPTEQSAIESLRSF